MGLVAGMEDTLKDIQLESPPKNGHEKRAIDGSSFDFFVRLLDQIHIMINTSIVSQNLRKPCQLDNALQYIQAHPNDFISW